MLDPKPGRTGSRISRPTKILSKQALKTAWRNSRDSGIGAGRPGIDNVSALQFEASLDRNLDMIVRTIKDGSFGFSRLKPVFIPKDGSDKKRMICIPIVRDRLVQRAIVQYLTTRKCLPIYDPHSFGFIQERGVKRAIEKAVELRGQFDWCLKADIVSFFDRIPRDHLKNQIKTAMRGHSLTHLLCKAVDCEVYERGDQKEELAKQGLEKKRGLRQGMPLSPILSNLALSKFDNAIRQRNIVMVRYVDDLILFFKSEAEMKEGEKFVREQLAKYDLSIPIDGKTQRIGPKGSFDFLGREIFHSQTDGYCARVSSGQIKKILDGLRDEYSLKKRISEKSNFQETVVKLGRSVSSYLGIYRDAYNFADFDRQIREAFRNILSQFFIEIFGVDSLASLSKEVRNFLGIGDLVIPAAGSDLEI